MFTSRADREDPTAKATLFEYDERGNLEKRTDALSRITAWSYDGLDRMIQETNAIDGLTALAYDAAGNVVRVTDPLNSTTDYGLGGHPKPASEGGLKTGQSKEARPGR